MTPEAPPQTAQGAKPQRVLACLMCQQRKIKCNRNFPCSNCIKSQTECIPAALVQRRRRRRFPERELLDRLRKYEDLLRQNKIPFEPLHKESTKEKGLPTGDSVDASDDEHPEPRSREASTPSSTVKSERVYEAKNVWQTMTRGFRDPGNESDSSGDDVRESAIRNAWSQSKPHDDHLLFGLHISTIDLATLHPDAVQIFRLWQLYLDNVNPLLKVTHTPTLQGRIIEAAGSVKTIEPTLEALMFSIYCTSIVSLREEECQNMFGSSKDDLLTRYHFGCQQALLKSGFLRTSDRDCLTALYLYLISVKANTAPQSLACMLGVAVRIAHRMGIHSETNLSKQSIFEAEMRRRLWWSLVLFDTRICELSYTTKSNLDPTWDCKIPLNINDTDLRPEMKDPPPRGKSTEAIFVVVRSAYWDFLRHTLCYLSFVNPALSLVAKHFKLSEASEGNETLELEQIFEDQYFSQCDLANPIHFMTVWMTRSHIAKCRLLEHQSTHSPSPGHHAEGERDIATGHAIRVLECDTKVLTSPLTKGFLWLNRFYFPFPAYMQLVQDLRRRPLIDQAERAWEAMTENHQSWFQSEFIGDSPVLSIFSKIILDAWAAREATGQPLEGTASPPGIVYSVKHINELLAQGALNTNAPRPNPTVDTVTDEFAPSMSLDIIDQTLQYGTGMQENDIGMDAAMFPQSPSQMPLDGNMDPLMWGSVGSRPQWGGW